MVSPPVNHAKSVNFADPEMLNRVDPREPSILFQIIASLQLHNALGAGFIVSEAWNF